MTTATIPLRVLLSFDWRGTSDADAIRLARRRISARLKRAVPDLTWEHNFLSTTSDTSPDTDVVELAHTLRALTVDALGPALADMPFTVHVTKGRPEPHTVGSPGATAIEQYMLG